MQSTLSYSDQYISNITNLEGKELSIVLAKITHPQLTNESIRIVNDDTDFVFQGELYRGIRFVVTKLVDDKGEYPYGSLEVCNIDGAITSYVMKYGHEKDMRITFTYTMRTTGTVERLVCGFVSRFIDDTGSGTLSAEWAPFPFTDQFLVKTNMDAVYSPGLKNS